MRPKCVQLWEDLAYFEVFITNFHAVAGHVWLAERGLVCGGVGSTWGGLGAGRVAERAGRC